MMHNALKILFPDFKTGDWLLQDDSDGPYVKKWNRTEPQPTPAEIVAAIPAAVRAQKITETKAEAARRILAKWPDWRQRNAALGLLLPEEVESCKQWITDIKAASDQIEYDLKMSADPAKFDVAGSARWPV